MLYSELYMTWHRWSDVVDFTGVCFNGAGRTRIRDWTRTIRFGYIFFFLNNTAPPNSSPFPQHAPLPIYPRRARKRHRVGRGERPALPSRLSVARRYGEV